MPVEEQEAGTLHAAHPLSKGARSVTSSSPTSTMESVGRPVSPFELMTRSCVQTEAILSVRREHEIAAEMAEADKEMAEAEIRAHKKIEARRQIKQGVQKTISKENDHQHYLLESSGVSSNLTETSLTAHSPNDYQDILFELARDKQQISVKHKEALESRSWHEGTRAMVVAA